MTKKDYELIATVLYDVANFSKEKSIYNFYCEIVGEMVKALEKENPLFNRKKFLRACGLMYKSDLKLLSKED